MIKNFKQKLSPYTETNRFTYYTRGNSDYKERKRYIQYFHQRRTHHGVHISISSASLHTFQYLDLFTLSDPEKKNDGRVSKKIKKNKANLKQENKAENGKQER